MENETAKRRTVVDSLEKIRELAMQTLEAQSNAIVILAGEGRCKGVEKSQAPQCLLDDLDLLGTMLIEIRNNAQDINTFIH